MRGFIPLLCVTTALANPTPPQVEESEYYSEIGRSSVEAPQGRFLYPFGPYILSPLGQGLLGLGALGFLLNKADKKVMKDMKDEMKKAPADAPAVDLAAIDTAVLPEARSLDLNAEGRILYPFGPYVLSPLGQGLLVFGLLGNFLNKRKEAKKPVADVIVTEAEAAEDPQGRFLYPFGPYVLSPLGAGLAGLGLGLALLPSNPKPNVKELKGRDLLGAIAYDDLDLEEEFALEEEFYRNLQSFEDGKLIYLFILSYFDFLCTYFVNIAHSLRKFDETYFKII
jgi:hypothetical protein